MRLLLNALFALGMIAAGFAVLFALAVAGAMVFAVIAGRLLDGSRAPLTARVPGASLHPGPHGGGRQCWCPVCLRDGCCPGELAGVRAVRR